jgi:hypothetical protein
MHIQKLIPNLRQQKKKLIDQIMIIMMAIYMRDEMNLLVSSTAFSASSTAIIAREQIS